MVELPRGMVKVPRKMAICPIKWWNCRPEWWNCRMECRNAKQNDEITQLRFEWWNCQIQRIKPPKIAMHGVSESLTSGLQLTMGRTCDAHEGAFGLDLDSILEHSVFRTACFDELVLDTAYPQYCQPHGHQGATKNQNGQITFSWFVYLWLLIYLNYEDGTQSVLFCFATSLRLECKSVNLFPSLVI